MSTGPNATDPLTGKRRLENPSDFVRIEIGEALARDIPVAPILLDGAPMPDADQLPTDLKELCDRQAEFIDYRTFDTDVQRLIKKLRVASSNVVASSNKLKGLASSLDRHPLKKYSLCTRREKKPGHRKKKKAGFFRPSEIALKACLKISARHALRLSRTPV
jgi:hypothetical protein